MRDLITNLLAQSLQLSKEDQSGSSQEIEFVSYYRLTDFGQLLKATEMVEQEQWELKIPKTEDNLTQGSVRVRREQNRSGCSPSYWFTVKAVVPGKPGRVETTVEINAGMFNAFKASISRGMLKLRCVLPIPGTEGTWPEGKNDLHKGALCWEVDVFYDENGVDFFPWVKVDLEVPSADLLASVPKFPLDYERAITEPYGRRTEEDEALVSSFYSGPFLYTHKREAEIAAALANRAKAPETPTTQPEAEPTSKPATDVADGGEATTEPTNTDEAGKQDDSSS